MNEQHPSTIQQITGQVRSMFYLVDEPTTILAIQANGQTIQQITSQVRSMFYLVDEPTTILAIQANGQTISACAAGQVAVDLRGLPRGATICVTLSDVPHHNPQIVAFTLMPA